jgi:hypothetical protein
VQHTLLFAAVVLLLPLQGVTRRSEWCKQRHNQIIKAGEQQAAAAQAGQDGQPVDAAAANNNLANLSKHQVRVDCV